MQSKGSEEIAVRRTVLIVTNAKANADRMCRSLTGVGGLTERFRITCRFHCSILAASLSAAREIHHFHQPPVRFVRQNYVGETAAVKLNESQGYDSRSGNWINPLAVQKLYFFNILAEIRTRYKIQTLQKKKNLKSFPSMWEKLDVICVEDFISLSFFYRKEAAQTSVGFVQVTFDHGNNLWVLAVASVVISVVAEVVHCLHVAAALQQDLHRVLAAVLAAQNQRCPEGRQGEGVTSAPLAGHI